MNDEKTAVNCFADCHNNIRICLHQKSIAGKLRANLWISPGDLELLGEYADYISKYSDYLAKLSAVEQDDLSVADLAYYTEVYARIMKKVEGI